MDERGTRRRGRPGGGQQAQSMLETAITLPLFLVFIFSLFSVAWMMFEAQGVQAAAGAAAREALLRPMSPGPPTCVATVEQAAQRAATVVTVNKQQLCARSGNVTRLTQLPAIPTEIGLTVDEQPTFYIPCTATATATYSARPLVPLLPRLTLTSSSTVTSDLGCLKP